MQRNQVGQGIPVPARLRSLPALPVRSAGPGPGRSDEESPPGPGPCAAGGVPAAPTALPLPPRLPAPRIAPGLPSQRWPQPPPAGTAGATAGTGPPGTETAGSGAAVPLWPVQPLGAPGHSLGGVCPLLSPDVYVDRGLLSPAGVPGAAAGLAAAWHVVLDKKAAAMWGCWIRRPTQDSRARPAWAGGPRACTAPRSRRGPQCAPGPPPAGHPRAGLPPRRARPGGFPADPGVPSPPRPGSGQPGPAGPGLPGGEGSAGGRPSLSSS